MPQNPPEVGYFHFKNCGMESGIPESCLLDDNLVPNLAARGGSITRGAPYRSPCATLDEIGRLVQRFTYRKASGIVDNWLPPEDGTNNRGFHVCSAPYRNFKKQPLRHVSPI